MIEARGGGWESPQLRTFRVVAETLNFTRAANGLA